jgi:hypothetical protein
VKQWTVAWAKAHQNTSSFKTLGSAADTALAPGASVTPLRASFGWTVLPACGVQRYQCMILPIRVVPSWPSAIAADSVSAARAIDGFLQVLVAGNVLGLGGRSRIRFGAVSVTSHCEVGPSPVASDRW